MNLDLVEQEDIESIAKRIGCFEELRDKTVLVTGASGLLGISIVRSCLKLNELFQMNIKVVAWVRNEKKLEYETKSEKLLYWIVQRTGFKITALLLQLHRKK